MESKRQPGVEAKQQNSVEIERLLQNYGCSAPRLAGAPDALFERHLKSDNVVESESSDARERYEAAARAVRDVLSDRWLHADETYTRKNPKRVYYVIDRIPHWPLARSPTTL
jgi:glycogen phosphorylase